MKKIVGMDILRVAAAFGIMAYHYFFIGPLQGFYSQDVFSPLMFLGEWGVDIFFIISGFFILQSTKNRTYKMFAKSRMKRIYPTFVIGSLFVLFLGVFMPDTNIYELLKRWFFSLILIGDLTSFGPLSSIYWTLFIEVRFYIIVMLVLFLGEKINKKIALNKMLLIWLVISLINTYWLNIRILEILLITKYAGHFVFGIILYQSLIKEKKGRSCIFLVLMASLLILHNVLGYAQWIRSLYPELIFTDAEIVVILLLLFYAVFCAIKTQTVKPTIDKCAGTLSALSFPFYLIHADLGYFIRTQFYRVIIGKSKWLSTINGTLVEYALMLIAILSSLLVAYIINYTVSRKTNNKKGKA